MGSKLWESGQKLPKDILVISKNDLHLHRKIGEGVFSSVALGEIKGKKKYGPVTIKRPRPLAASEETVLREIQITFGLKHRNVIKLVCVAVGESPDGLYDHSDLNWLVLSFASKGDLLNFVNERIYHGVPLNERLWTKLSLGIAKGMSYIHEKLIVHSDLHVKNCFVNNHNVVKVGDFGLSYKLESNETELSWLQGPIGDIGRPNVPITGITGIRWKAPELIPGDDFPGLLLRPADIWSYGVLLYEFWTEGKLPFGSIQGSMAVASLITQGSTPLNDKESHDFPSYILEIMKKCFRYAPNSRPKFPMIVQEMEKAYFSLCGKVTSM